ncbi:YtxH domain-containing protein [Pontibacter sp. BT310]|jgi:gas vesicle protein|uniref:YtxH domain-containing protein n=1 Tax=Pontibacter populi TaxID=890055 RepID=A0ABS6X979_9BACT|nr:MULTISPECIES: YtxH domain-containing protein [Pontibacter]MBJ6116872.1 YtxH domain-containing protein [Pontibacter sp. BT310]MBR0569294.1 YtxH domain-containing protein [Microvirga sp. STS03]MBW3363725.1 YtxH domain-containing protein [Pontibacter populi]
MKDNSGKIILALLAGASAGVIAGLMMAPDTGEVTRTSVKKWASKMSKDLEKNLQTGLDEIKNMSAGAMDKFGEMKSGMSGSGSTTSGSQKSGTTGGNSSTGGSATGGNA